MSTVPTNINNYLRQFAHQLEERILEQFPPLHQPGEPFPAELARSMNPLHATLAIAGISKRWRAELRRRDCHLKHILADRPTLMVISLRPNYGLTSTEPTGYSKRLVFKRTVRVHSVALPQSLTAKGRC
jgi:hypothetical protein